MAKKKYTKPVVIVESFQLNAAVASACSTDPNKIVIHYGFDNCTAEEEEPGWGYFGNQCAYDVAVEGDGNDEICYHGLMPATEVALYS